MYFYSVNSRQKRIHSSYCPYFKRIKKTNRRTFDTKKDADTQGYHLCKLCSPIGAHFRKEYRQMFDYSIENGMTFEYKDEVIKIITPHSRWKIITNGNKNKMYLYHKNKIYYEDQKSLIDGYHRQAVRSTSILGYMEYINKHDNFRSHNPLKQKHEYQPPRKGTKRYRKEMYHRKRRQRRESIENVLNILAELSLES